MSNICRKCVLSARGLPMTLNRMLGQAEHRARRKLSSGLDSTTSSGCATFCSVPQSGPRGQACRYSNWHATQPAGSPAVRYPNGMDHLEVLREKIARLRAEIAQIQGSNQEYRLRESVETEAQVAHGERQERLLAIQQELAQVGDLGRRILSLEKMKEQNRPRLHLVEQEKAS